MNDKVLSVPEKEKFLESVEAMRAGAARQTELALLQQLELPLWGNDQRGVPNGVLRSALFAALARGKRKRLERERLPSPDGTEIIYTGLRLDQDYLSLWECIVHAAKDQQLGDRCEVSAYHLLKLLGKKDTGGNRQILYKKLANLQATAIEIRQGRYTYTGSLVGETFRDESSGRIVIILHQRLVSLFQYDQFTKINWNIRMKLKGPLAKWLHGFYATHAMPVPMRVETIHRLCGSEAKSMTNFEIKSLMPALKEVSEVSAKFGEHFSFSVENNLLRVTRKQLENEKRKPLP